MSILDPLHDSSENPAIPEPTSSDDLEKQAREPASQLYVDQAVAGGIVKHKATCGARARVRRWAIWLAIGVGAFAAIDVVAVMSGKAVIRDAIREVLAGDFKQVVREEVREVLRDEMRRMIEVRKLFPMIQPPGEK